MKKYPGVYKDSEGKIFIKPRVKDIFGKTKRTTIRGFKSEKEAYDLKNELQKKNSNKGNNKVLINTKNGEKSCKVNHITYRQVFMENLEYKHTKGRNGDGTYNTCLRRNEKHILPEIGDMDIFDITTLTYSELQLKLKQKGLDIKTINGLHSDIESALKYATLFYGLKYNVAMMVGPIYEDRDNIDNFITIDDMNKIGKEESLNSYEWELIAKSLEKRINKEENLEKKVQCIKDLLFFVCEFILMMRIGEVQALDYESIIYDKKIIFLNKAYSKDAKKITPLKNRKVRFLYPTDFVLELFKICEEEDAKYIGFNRHQLIFGHTGHFSRTTMLRLLKTIAVENNIHKNLTNHKLRHGIISNMLYANADPSVVAEMAGHNKEMTFNVYNQSVNKAKVDLVEKLNTFYVPNAGTIFDTHFKEN